MSREITTHAIDPANEQLTITVMDEAGSGGANHHYTISGFTKDHPSKVGPLAGGKVHITLQNGPIQEAGVNGLTNEVLLAIVADRLTSFQAGPYACNENAVALGGVLSALEWLKYRTEQRVERGVEGTHTI